MGKDKTVDMTFLMSLTVNELLKFHDYFTSQMKDRYTRFEGVNEVHITHENKIIYDRCKSIVLKIDEVLLYKFLGL